MYNILSFEIPNSDDVSDISTGLMLTKKGLLTIVACLISYLYTGSG